MITPLNVKEACAAIPCCESMLRRMKRTGQLPKDTYYYVGRRLFFLPDKLDEWKRNGGTAQFKETA
jgi:hypothetical protein